MGRPPIINRDQLLDAARNVFTQKGFDASTLADIAGELGVTAAAVLRHFESKQALFNDAMRPTVALPQCILDLQTIDASTDPRIVLRNLAEGWVPFAEKTIAQNIAVQQHLNSRRAILLPFEPGAEDSPPRRGIRIVTEYFRRAREAGVIHVADPKAAALMFMGSLVGYVFIHHVVQALPQPYPLPDYIDALLDLWSRGGVSSPVGGSRGRNEFVPAEEDRAADHHRDRRDRVAAVHAAEASSKGDRPVGDARSADGKRGLARRRTRHPRPRR